MEMRALNVEELGGTRHVPVRPLQHAFDVLLLALRFEIAQRKNAGDGIETKKPRFSKDFCRTQTALA